MTSLRARLALVPLRVRLVAAMLLLVALGLLVAGFGATAVLRGYLLDRVDSQLIDASHNPGMLLRGGQDFGGEDDGRPVGPNDRFYVRITASDGTSRTNSTALSRPDIATVTPAIAVQRSGKPYNTGSVQGSGQWRVLVTAATDGSSLTLASQLTDVGATVHRLVVIEVVVGALVLLLLGGGTYAVVRTSLHPLREVEQTAAAIAGGELSLRVPRQDDRTEVGRLALAFNSMLGRIEDAFGAQRASEAQARDSEARLRQFVADASHELRTPLTSIRGFAELYRQGAVPVGPDLDRVMGRVEGEASRMGQLVEEMLLLARLDQQRPLASAPVDLLRLATDAVHDVQAVDPGRPVTLEVDQASQPPVVTGDEARLRQVLVNLLGNAVTHTPSGSPVVVRVRTTADSAVLEVADSGAGLGPEEAARVFERFYRADAARTRTSGGSGLGLSIVRAVVEAHGGRVDVRSTRGHGATFVVELPLAA